MENNNFTLSCDSWIMEFACNYTDDSSVEERVQMAKFIGRVGQKNYDTTIFWVLENILDDDSSLVVENGVDSCLDIMQSILNNSTSYEDPSSCISQLKLVLKKAFDKNKNPSVRFKIMTVLKDFALSKVRTSFIENSDSTSVFISLKNQVSSAVDILAVMLTEASNMTTIDRINCLGIFVYDLRGKYYSKVSEVLSNLINAASPKPTHWPRMELNKQIVNMIILNFLNNSDSHINSSVVIAELKSVNPRMHKSALEAISPERRRPEIGVTKKIPSNEYERLSCHLESPAHLEMAVNYCRRENNYSLLFNCTLEKLNTIFRMTPGLEQKVQLYAEKKLQRGNIELRIAVILQNIARKFTK